MITVNKALQTILSQAQPLGVENVSLPASLGRVLKEDILADRDFPPFDRVSMDGIAIDTDAFINGQRSFLIEGVQPAGSPQKKLQHPSHCLEVMTGAPLPKNTNAVIRYEDVALQDNIAKIQIDSVHFFQNIHTKGKDRKKNDVLINKNTPISAAEIGVLATVGKASVSVARLPKVMIVSTGDELVDVDAMPEAHQIRKSNVYTLAALLKRLSLTTDMDHLIDKKSIVTEKIKAYLNHYDVLLFSGAVSKGKYDFLPEVLEELGVLKLFHKVAQRPGKPFWFGRTDTCTIFAFPGNPVSTFVNCLVYFYPWYQAATGATALKENAILKEDVLFKPNLDYFLQVRLSYQFGHLIANPIKSNGSGDLASLANADAFVHLPNGKNVFKKGEAYPVIRFR